jgi:hypothetical protein
MRFGAADIDSAKAVWTRNGGQFLNFSAADSALFAQQIDASAQSILRNNDVVRAEFDKYARACRKYEA